MSECMFKMKGRNPMSRDSLSFPFFELGPRIESTSAVLEDQNFVNPLSHLAYCLSRRMSRSDISSLGLRLSLLESLTYGEADHSPSTSKTSILLRSHNAQEKFQHDIERYKSIVHFVEEYRSNKAYLQPSIQNISNFNGDTTPSNGKDIDGSIQAASMADTSYSSLLSMQSVIALLLESEKDIRQLDRDLRLCEHHQEKGTAGAGKLAGESFVPLFFGIKTC